MVQACAADLCVSRGCRKECWVCQEPCFHCLLFIYLVSHGKFSFLIFPNSIHEILNYC